MISRLRALCLLAVSVALLPGCAAPVAMQAASFAADGVAFMATGKGTMDLALSTVAGDDCRLANIVRERPICAPNEAAIIAAAEAAAEVSPAAMGLAPLPGDAMGASVSALNSGMSVRFVQSPGMNMVEITGAPVASALSGRMDGAGNLQVYLTGGAGVPPRALFTVPGYSRNPGAFTGALIGSRFLTPDSFIR